MKVAAEMLRVLMVEDLPSDAELNQHEIRRSFPDCSFLRVETREEYLAAMASFRPDIILSDYKLPQFDGMSALKLALERLPEIPFIIITGSMNEDTAVECMKAGAWDYVIKEHVKRLGSAVQGALEAKRLRRDRRQTEEELRFKDAAIANSTNPIVITSADGTLRYVNAAWVRLHGYESSEVIGRRAYELWPEDAAAFVEALGPSGSGIVERAMKRKDGTLFVAQVSVSIVSNQAGEVAGVLISEVDITDRKRTDDRLHEQLDELHRWHEVMLGREDRVAALKREVNELCRQLGAPARYPSQEEGGGDGAGDCRATGDDRPVIGEAVAHGPGREG